MRWLAVELEGKHQEERTKGQQQPAFIYGRAREFHTAEREVVIL